MVLLKFHFDPNLRGRDLSVLREFFEGSSFKTIFKEQGLPVNHKQLRFTITISLKTVDPFVLFVYLFPFYTANRNDNCYKI